MLKIITGLSGIMDLLYGTDTFLTSEQLAMLGTHIDLLARHYQKLSTDAFEAGQTLWHTVPKLHFYIAHLLQQASLINPVWVQGYSSESMVGTTAQVYAMSQNGPFHTHVQKVVMNKYRVGLKLLMES